jgi:hypothetical protein
LISMPNSSSVAQPAPVPPTRPATPAKRGRLFYLGLVGVIGGFAFCLLGIVLILVSFVVRV